MSSNEDKPITLAGLRSARGRSRASKPPAAPQLGLLFASEAPFAPPQSQKKPQPVPPAAPRIWTVRALVSDIRNTIESTHMDLWIEGEISNCRPAPLRPFLLHSQRW